MGRFLQPKNALRVFFYELPFYGRFHFEFSIHRGLSATRKSTVQLDAKVCGAIRLLPALTMLVAFLRASQFSASRLKSFLCTPSDTISGVAAEMSAQIPYCLQTGSGSASEGARKDVVHYPPVSGCLTTNQEVANL